MRRFIPRSLTGRLVTGAVALVLIVVLGIGAGTYFWLRSFLFDRLDQQLSSTASTSSMQDVFNGTVSTGGVRAPQLIYAIAIRFDGQAIPPKPSGSVETLNLAAEDLERLAQRSSQAAITTHNSAGVQLRITVRSFLFNGVPAKFIVGLSTEEADRTLDRLIKLELIIGLAALVVAFVATRAGVRFGLRHLLRVSQTAKEVATELKDQGKGLDRRVEVHDPGTEVGELADSMNTLLATYETEYAARLASEQRMRQFLADASHELRTPLTSIRGYAELARMQQAYSTHDTDDADSEDADAAADNLARIESEGTRMSRLVDDLLILARTDGGAVPDFVAVDMANLVDDVVTGVEAAFPGRGIEQQVPTGLTVRGDPDQLLRVLRNLVTNAALYTRPDGPILVRAHAEAAGVTVQVLDSGPGLPPEEAAHVFERFWRANKARTSTSGGTGLGLSIVSSIVAAHGGTVRFDSAVETGSTATVWLPSSR
ncbi:MAG TPA: HAMP domain-containing sensor histidine kinase [Jatrophihabitans sp.]